MQGKFALAIAAVLTCFLAPAPAFAQQQAEYDANRLVTMVAKPEMRALVSEFGHSIIFEQENGRPVIGVETEGGVKYVMAGTVCRSQDKNSRCGGLIFRWTYNRGSAVRDTALALANTRLTAMKIHRSRDGELIYVDRYLVLDKGMTMGNVAFNAEVFEDGVFKAMEIFQQDIDN